MRKRLIQEKRSQWADQEEQRKINSAFAHDLRTPLTVIKGYTEFLLRYVPQGKVTEEMLMERLKTMQQQEKRLLEFARTMSTIQEVERRELRCEWQRPDEVLRQFELLSGCLEEKIRINVEAEGMENGELLIDMDAVMEAYENILSNSLRFAREWILVRLSLCESELCIYIKDDGRGFSDRALREADQFYFSETKGEDTHFGLGISIAKMLCEKHGGGLNMINSIDGGAIVAMELTVGRRE